jgi:hypothetical protein
MQAGDYSRRLLSAGMRASRFDIRNEKKRPFNFALPKHRPDALALKRFQFSCPRWLFLVFL